MAYTEPRTWVASETVTAALMNTHVRDNLGAIVSDLAGITGSWMKIGRMTADQTWTSDTTLADLTNLSWTIGASEVWIFFSALQSFSPGNANYKFNLTFPAGATGYAGVQSDHPSVDGSSPLGTDFVSIGDDSNDFMKLLAGLVVNSTTAGTVQLQAAQNTTNGTATRIREHSWLAAIRTT